MNTWCRRETLAIVLSTARRVVPVLASLLVASTAGAAKHEAPAMPAGMVMLRAQGGTMRNFFSMLKPIGTAMDVAILVVDGNDAKIFGTRRQVIVKPGHHELLIRCSYVLDNQDSVAKGYLSFDFLADHVYEIDAGLPCVARVVDKTAPVSNLRGQR